MEEDPTYYDQFWALSEDKALCHRIMVLWECFKVPNPDWDSFREFLARVAYLFDAQGSQFQRIWEPEHADLQLIYEWRLHPLLEQYPALLSLEHLCAVGALRLREELTPLPKAQFRVPGEKEVGRAINKGLFLRLVNSQVSLLNAFRDYLAPIGKRILEENPKVKEFLAKDPRFMPFISLI